MVQADILQLTVMSSPYAVHPSIYILSRTGSHSYLRQPCCLEQHKTVSMTGVYGLNRGLHELDKVTLGQTKLHIIYLLMW